MDTQEAFRLEFFKEEFCKTGLEYYVVARASWSAGIDKVTGNLFHHAIEMLRVTLVGPQKHQKRKLSGINAAAFPRIPIYWLPSGCQWLIFGIFKIRSNY